MALSLVGKLTFFCLIQHADDEGRLQTHPKHADEAWLHVGLADSAAAFQALEERGIIQCYEASDRRYVQIRQWAAHQKVDHPNASDYPPPPLAKIRERSRKRATPPQGDSRALENLQPPTGSDRIGSEGTGPDLIASLPTDAGRLCDVLARAIEDNGSRRPTVTKDWLAEADRLLRLDKRPIDEALELIAWSQQDGFWKGNILSFPKFRDQYDRLRLARDRAGTGANRALTVGREWSDLADQLREAGQ